jgi:hypothetical protein
MSCFQRRVEFAVPIKNTLKTQRFGTLHPKTRQNHRGHVGVQGARAFPVFFKPAPAVRICLGPIRPRYCTGTASHRQTGCNRDCAFDGNLIWTARPVSTVQFPSIFAEKGEELSDETVSKRREITVSRRVLVNKRHEITGSRRVLVSKRREITVSPCFLASNLPFLARIAPKWHVK